MRRQVWIGAVLLVPALTSATRGGDQPCGALPARDVLKRWHPVGGWHPYGGGLLHWWNPHCFPCAGGPDDYCRKTLPCPCWPPYPPYFQAAPPEKCPSSSGNCPCGKPLPKTP